MLRMQERGAGREDVLLNEDVFRDYAVEEYMMQLPKVAHEGPANSHPFRESLWRE